jgi:hypothetical protein
MDNAVALVQAYLRINGYFTVAEYPILETHGRNAVQMATDIDILAFRFPGAIRQVSGKHSARSRRGEPTSIKACEIQQFCQPL